MKTRFRYWLICLCMVSALATFIGIPNLAFAATRVSPSHAASPNVVGCNAGWAYSNVTTYGQTLFAVGPTQSNHNGTGSTADMTLTSTSTGTVTLTTSLSVQVNANAILAGVTITSGISVAYSISITQSNTTHILVPAGKTGNGNYGVWRLKAVGHYYYTNSTCQTTVDYGNITTYSPVSVGWNTWIS